MKHIRECQECGYFYGDTYSCDTCGKDLLSEFFGIPLTLDCSYGHYLDGTEYHFCNFSCLLQFISKELVKVNPRPIITGQEQGEQNEKLG